MIDPTAFIHPKAHVEDATIGARTKVWQFASVIRGAVVGADCTIASGVLFDGSHCGDGTIICQNLAAGPGFLIGNRCFIGPNVTLCNDMWPSADKQGFDADALRAGQWTIIIEDRVSIGANAVVLPGVVIGRGAVVSAAAVVGINVPAGHLYRRDSIIVPLGARHRQRMIPAGGFGEDGVAAIQ